MQTPKGEKRKTRGSKKCIYLFGVLRRFQHFTGHIMTGSWKGRGNQYIQFAKDVYCKLPTNGKQLPAFPLKAMTGSNPGLRGGRQECYHSATMAPYKKCKPLTTYNRFSPLGDHLDSPELEMESKNTTDVLSNVLSQLQALTASVDLLVEGQSSMNKKLDSLSNRVDAIEQSKKSNAGEISKIKDDYSKLVEVTNEISLVQAKTQSQVQKLDNATKSIPRVEAGIANPENIVVIYGLPETHQEDIYVKVRDMLKCMQKDYTKLTETVRLKSLVNGKPGVVKASFSSVADKVDILRAKQRLKGTQYGKVFI